MKEHSNRNHHNATGPFRYCQRMLAGEVCLPKLCLLNYDCSHCAFDQWLDNVDTLSGKGRSEHGDTTYDCYDRAA